jgi:hypothetical protein
MQQKMIFEREHSQRLGSGQIYLWIWNADSAPGSRQEAGLT